MKHHSNLLLWSTGRFWSSEHAVTLHYQFSWLSDTSTSVPYFVTTDIYAMWDTRCKKDKMCVIFSLLSENQIRGSGTSFIWCNLWLHTIPCSICCLRKKSSTFSVAVLFLRPFFFSTPFFPFAFTCHAAFLLFCVILELDVRTYTLTHAMMRHAKHIQASRSNSSHVFLYQTDLSSQGKVIVTFLMPDSIAIIRSWEWNRVSGLPWMIQSVIPYAHPSLFSYSLHSFLPSHDSPMHVQQHMQERMRVKSRPKVQRIRRSDQSRLWRSLCCHQRRFTSRDLQICCSHHWKRKDWMMVISWTSPVYQEHQSLLPDSLGSSMVKW